ncbi:MAG: 6-carboxytetrahydropterin synthase [Bacteroidales bacterium]|nr:6-carboxytetrahydropterin synthase [Bacteroidales bacterium]
MSIIRVTKEFGFEMAHALVDYDGPCRNVHGHSYRLFVTISGKPSEKKGDPKKGMVIDFGDLKRIVKKNIVDIFDHTVLISGTDSNERIEALRRAFGNLLVSDYQPTCENLVADIAARLKPLLPPDITLFSVKLYETATSYAEWYASDNE